MFKKINIIFSMLFFLLGTNVLADSNWKSASYQSGLGISEFASGEAAGLKEQATAKLNAAKEKTVAESAAVNQSAENKQPAIINYILPVLVGIVSVIGIASYWLIFRRKHIH
ncbi:hypothetical protein [Neobacillus sp. Marseille-QA0830]